MSAAEEKAALERSANKSACRKQIEQYAADARWRIERAWRSLAHAGEPKSDWESYGDMHQRRQRHAYQARGWLREATGFVERCATLVKQFGEVSTPRELKHVEGMYRDIAGELQFLGTSWTRYQAEYPTAPAEVEGNDLPPRYEPANVKPGAPRTLTAADVGLYHVDDEEARCSKCGARPAARNLYGIDWNGLTTAVADQIRSWICADCFGSPKRWQREDGPLSRVRS